MRGLVLVLCLTAGTALAQDASPPPPALAPRPVLTAIDLAVEKWWTENREPCRRSINRGVPCFPVEVRAEGPTVSVRDSLREIGTKEGHSEHRPPTPAEMAPARPGPQSTIATVAAMSFDPVCAAKAALKAVTGSNDTFFLYHLRDASGEHVVMRDQRLHAQAFQGSAEFLGEFHGECEAVAAFRHEERRERPPAASLELSSDPPGATAENAP
jgi:hypothetical protein